MSSLSDDEILAMFYEIEQDRTVEQFAIAFARAIAAREREACAKICTQFKVDAANMIRNDKSDDDYHDGRADGAEDCAAAIRARGEV